MEELDHCVENAERAERLALQMTVESQRSELLGIAADWRRRADEVSAILAFPSTFRSSNDG